jgi:hypothetical protein
MRTFFLLCIYKVEHTFDREVGMDSVPTSYPVGMGKNTMWVQSAKWVWGWVPKWVCNISSKSVELMFDYQVPKI